MKYSTVYKGGRCWNASHRDAGTIVHVIEGESPNGYWGGKALCGAEPGRGSYGWADTNKKTSCKKCLAKINQYNEKDLRHGYWEERCPYYTEKETSFGTKKSIYINGKQEGCIKYYTAKGFLYREAIYVNGKTCGPVKSWHIDTRVLRFTGEYINNFRKHGKWTHFFGNGQISNISYYDNNVPYGVSSRFDKEGNLVKETLYIS